jgi:hypothetical protein
MMDDLMQRRRQDYLELVVELFPDGDERLDVLCRSVAKLLQCSFATVVIVGGDEVFAVGAYHVPVRRLSGMRKVPFDRTKRQEFTSISKDLSHALFLDRQSAELQYFARVPMWPHGVYLGGLLVGDVRPHAELTEEQWQGFEEAANLAQKILLRSEALKIQLGSLIEVIVP